MRKLSLLLSVVVVFLLGLNSWAQSNSQSKTPRVGRDANSTKDVASDYFSPAREPEAAVSSGSSDHYLALHIGKIVSGEAWEWGERGKQTNTGSYSTGVTYRVQEWRTMDLNVRIDFNEYKVVGESPLKMSLLPLLIFPDASSKFPLYFGFGGGLGIFFKQVPDESQISFDYQLIMGARFFNVMNTTGFFIETGMKNHLLLTSSGQFNGAFLTAGALFTF